MAHLRIALGADHGGFDLKRQLADHLGSLGHTIEDCGTGSTEPVDYPVFARAVAERVASGACDLGIVVDGAGIGSAIAANKIAGVRAAACYSEALARNAREHNDANVLTLGARHVDVALARRIVETFLASRCTEPRHLARVRLIAEIEAAAAAGGAPVAEGDIERIARRVRELLDGSAPPPADASVEPAQLAALIDHTLLKPEATDTDVQRLCEEARRYGFYSVCVNPTFVQRSRLLLRDSPVKVCCVVGFPLGAQPPEIKVLEARRAIREGAREIDMVINIGALKGGDDELVRRDIRGVVEACKEGRALCKVILETALLTDEEKVRGCQLAMRAGADYVKTSTGFSKGGATVEDIELMVRTVAARKLGVKASGGIRSYDDAVRMIRAGATRIGCSSSVQIIEQARARAAGRG